MSYSFDNMTGWELFNTPFSSPVRKTPPRQQAGRPQQQPSEAMQHNATPTAVQRNSSPAPTQKAPQPARQAAPQQKPPAVKQSNPAPSAPAPTQTVSTKQESTVFPKAPASTQPAAPQKELMLDMSFGSGTAPIDDTAKRKAHEEVETKRKAEFDERQRTKKQAEETVLQKLNAIATLTLSLPQPDG